MSRFSLEVNDNIEQLIGVYLQGDLEAGSISDYDYDYWDYDFSFTDELNIKAR